MVTFDDNGSTRKQSHYIEVAQGDIFMEEKMWFGHVLGRLAVSKKKGGGGQLWATFEGVFFMFSGAKKNLKFFLKIA